MYSSKSVNQRDNARQSGVSTLFAVVSFSIFLSSLAVVEIGNFMWEKGKAQRIADLTSLSAARTMQQGINADFVNSLAAQNGLGPDETLTLTCMVGPDYSAVPDGQATPAATAVSDDQCQSVNVVQARVQKTVSTLFPFTSLITGPMQVDVVAQATLTPTVTGTISSGLLSLPAGLLPIDVALLSGQDLITADVDFTLIQLAAELGMGADDLVGPAATPVPASDLLDAALAAAGIDTLGIVPALAGDLQGLLSGDVMVLLNDILDVQGDQSLTALANIDLNSFIRSVGLDILAQENPTGINLTPNGISLDSNESALLANFAITGIDGITLQILNPPKIYIAEKLPYQSVIAYETVDQLALFVDLSVSGGEGLLQALTNVLSNTAGLTVTTEFKLRLRLSAAQGAVEVSDLTCSLPQTDNEISMAVSSQVVNVELCPCDNDPGSTNPMDLLRLGISGSPSGGGLLGGLINLVTNLLNVVDPLLDTDDVVLTLANNGDPAGDPTFAMSDPQVFFGTDYPFAKTGSASLGDTFNLDQTLNGVGSGDYVIAVKNNGGTAQTIVSNVFKSTQGLLTAATAALGPALNQLGGVLDEVLGAVNLQLSPVVATVDSVNCENAMLTK